MALQILLAEDNQTFADSVSRFIGPMAGVRLVAHAKDGDEALERAIALHPDVILMDIAMPHMNGLQVAHKLRELGHTSTIIFLSMHSDDSYRDAARKAGGAHFVSKADFVTELHPLIAQMVKDHLPLDGA